MIELNIAPRLPHFWMYLAFVVGSVCACSYMGLENRSYKFLMTICSNSISGLLSYTLF